MSAAGDARDLVQFGPYAGTPAVYYDTQAAPAHAAPSVGIGDLWRVLKQRKGTVLIAFVVLYALVAVTTFLIYRFAPAYPSEGFLRFDPPVMDARATAVIVPKDYIEQQLQTEAARIKQLDVLLDLLKLPEIKATEFYRWYSTQEKCLYDLQDMLFVAPVRDTNLIRVRIALKNPKEATLIVTRLMEQYRKFYNTRSETEGSIRLKAVKDARDQAENDLKSVQSRIAQVRSQRDMPAIEAERSVLSDEIAVLTTNRADFLARRADLDSQIQYVNGFDPRNLPLSNEMRVIIEADPVLRYYRQQVEALDIELRVQAGQFGQNNRMMKQLKQRREEYSLKEQARRDELTDDLRGRQIEQLQSERARLQNVLDTLQEQLAEKEANLRDLDRSILEFQNLTKNEDRLSDQLKQLDMDVRDAETRAEAQKQRGQLSIASTPQDAYEPSRPNFILYLGGGIALALFGAIGLAFLLEFTDKAVRTPIDVARHGHISVLGVIPQLDADEEAEIESIEEATRKAPHSIVAESYRQVRAHLTFSGPYESQRTLLITSPSAEDGKTATAINLAVTFAQANQRVLLVDCNFRRPGIRAAFPDAKAEGLSNILIGRARLEDVVTKTDNPNLDVVSSGPMPPTPAELLGSKFMHEFIELAKTKYDRVLFDGPPSLLISDALVIARHVDGVIVVVRAVANSKGVLRRTREQLDQIGARVVGAVLNGVHTRPGGYYRQHYRDFYEYTSDETIPRELPGIPPNQDAPRVEEPPAEFPEKSDRP